MSNITFNYIMRKMSEKTYILYYKLIGSGPLEDFTPKEHFTPTVLDKIRLLEYQLCYSVRPPPSCSVKIIGDLQAGHGGRLGPEEPRS